MNTHIQYITHENIWASMHIAHLLRTYTYIHTYLYSYKGVTSTLKPELDQPDGLKEQGGRGGGSLWGEGGVVEQVLSYKKRESVDFGKKVIIQ